MTPKPATRPAPWARRLLVAVLLLAVLPDTAPAQEPPPIPSTSRAYVDGLSAEVRAIGQRLEQITARKERLAKQEARLSEEVAALKRKPAGMVRDNRLGTALKDLRGVLAETRNLDQLARILTTTLRTRQVALARRAHAGATSLTRAGEAAVRAGDDETARLLFFQAMDFMLMEGLARERPDPIRPGQLPPPRPVIMPPDIHTPDELRETAQVFRDAGEELRYRAQVFSAELARLTAERETLHMLLSVPGVATAPGQEALTRLETAIGTLKKQVDQTRTRLAAHLLWATRLETLAAREEAALLTEPQPERNR